MRRRERGDTLIEVLVAISVFGVIVVGTFALMNRGVTQMYDSMEKTQVRMLLNGQAEALTYARDQYLRSQSMPLTTTQDQRAKQAWEWIKNQTDNPATVPGITNCSPSGSAFSLLTPDTGITANSTITSPIADGFPAPQNGIWIEQMPSSGGVTPSYIDFYIRACWMQNSNNQTQVLSTVVRLYDN